MRLRDVPIDSAIQSVSDLAMACRNVYGQLSMPTDAGWTAYVGWADRCERELRSLFDDPRVVARLHTERYWNILGGLSPARMNMLIGAEVEVQAARLEELADRMRGYLSLRTRPGAIAVLDTNVLLHHQRIDRVPWARIVKAVPVRLVIPLRVLQELDEKGYTGTEKIRRRVASAVAPLDERQSQFEQQGFAALGEETTVEYLSDEGGHQPRSRADEEILDRAEFLRQVTSRPAVVITGDRSMRARATARGSGLTARLMPAEFRRDQVTPEGD